MTDILTNQPALARTDTTRERARSAPAAGIDQHTVRRRGMALVAGSVAWATTVLVFGPTADGLGGRLGDFGGLFFQLGLFALLSIQLGTRATGTSRKAVAMLKVEHVLLGLASIWSLLHAVLPESLQDSGPMMVLDVFWPLSMLGMFIIGIKVATAGRWRAALRIWPLVAETWVVVTVPSMAIFGDGAARVVGGVHLIVGYALLGVLLARRPALTGARGN